MAAKNAKYIKTAWGGPWGVSFAINLTPDKETGIAEWREDHFIQAMRTGKSHMLSLTQLCRSRSSWVM